ncbi:MAG TPA: alkaline phosphatase family protein [Capsulimonadaceae bacterium]|nr:alkaline phosphatase family protein [Capsulimonadaceae bacterium]
MPLLVRAVALFAVFLAASAYGAATPPTIKPDPEIARYAIPANHEPSLSREREIALLHKKVKYIFVIYQENRSFDSYFGTFPGASGLFSQPALQTLGFNQNIIDTDGSTKTIQPFRIGPKEYAADLGDVGHAHKELLAKMDIVSGASHMDHYALVEERARNRGGGNPSLAAKQFGELTMAYEDGDTIPFLWRYANRFVLCDHIFQLMAGPSTPGNIAIIGAQTGATQWMLHPEEAGGGNGGRGVPIIDDTNPLWGSPLDPFKSVDGIPYKQSDSNKVERSGLVQYNLTFATIPLTLSGAALGDIAKSDRDPKGDLRDIHEDIAKISASGKQQLGWGWYQEGYGSDPKPTGGPDPVDAEGMHFSYVTHHNGPQYFGYLANNPKMSASMRGLTDFLTAVKNNALPSQGGLFFLKGGGHNFLGLSPADPDLGPRANFTGDDDHPNDSDSEISEAMAAEMINAIANSRYWKKCAIIITWDDSQGAYDHVPPPIRSFGPDGAPLSDGPRVPFLLISPYSRTHIVDHDEGDQACVVKFADTVFGLIPLADLPDEEKGRKIGEQKGLKNEGPFDDRVVGITDLVSAFDPARLLGKAAPLPASYALIPEPLIHKLPQQTGIGLEWVGVEPTDYQKGIVNHIPADFNPRP